MTYAPNPPNTKVVPGPQSFTPATATTKTVPKSSQTRATPTLTTATAFTEIAAPAAATHSIALQVAHPTLSSTNSRHY